MSQAEPYTKNAFLLAIFQYFYELMQTASRIELMQTVFKK